MASEDITTLKSMLEEMNEIRAGEDYGELADLFQFTGWMFLRERTPG